MGYLGFKLRTYFKDYESLEENGISKVNKHYYLDNIEFVEDAVNKTKVSTLKIICTIVLLIYFLFWFFIFISNCLYDTYISIPTNLQGLFGLLCIFMLYSTFFTPLFYFLCYFDKTIRKSNFLRIIFILYFVFYIVFMFCFIFLLGDIPPDFN